MTLDERMKCDATHTRCTKAIVVFVHSIANQNQRGIEPSRDQLTKCVEEKVKPLAFPEATHVEKHNAVSQPTAPSARLSRSVREPANVYRLSYYVHPGRVRTITQRILS
jgi:hypothetical protein